MSKDNFSDKTSIQGNWHYHYQVLVRSLRKFKKYNLKYSKSLFAACRNQKVVQQNLTEPARKTGESKSLLVHGKQLKLKKGNSSRKYIIKSSKTRNLFLVTNV